VSWWQPGVSTRTRPTAGRLYKQTAAHRTCDMQIRSAASIRRTCAAVVLILTTTAAAAAGPAWRYSGNAGLSYDSNPANIRSGAAELPASFFAAGFNAERSAGLSTQSALLWRLSLNGEAYERHERLSNAKAGSLLRVSTRWDEGFYAPLLAAWVSAAYAESGSRIRTGSEYRGGVYLQERLTTALALRIGGQWSERHAQGAAFDLAGRSALLNLDWTPVGSASFYAGYQYYDGDLVSTAAPGPVALAAASAIDEDDAFGGSAANRFAFRLDAHSHLGTLGFNYALSPAYAVDLQLQNILARANTGNRYRREFASVSLLARF